MSQNATQFNVWFRETTHQSNMYILPKLKYTVRYISKKKKIAKYYVYFEHRVTYN